MFDDLIDAAEAYAPDDEILVACKVEEGRLFLSMDGKWKSIAASSASEQP